MPNLVFKIGPGGGWAYFYEEVLSDSPVAFWKVNEAVTSRVAIDSMGPGPQNLCLNPLTNSYDIAGWVQDTSTIGVVPGSQVNFVGFTQPFGRSCLQVTTTAGSQGIGYNGLTQRVPAGTTMTATIYMKGNSGGELLQMFLGTNASGDYKAVAVTLTTAWLPYSVTWTSVNEGTAPPRFGISANTSSAQTFFLNACNITYTSTAIGFDEGLRGNDGDYFGSFETNLFQGNPSFEGGIASGWTFNTITNGTLIATNPGAPGAWSGTYEGRLIAATNGAFTIQSALATPWLASVGNASGPFAMRFNVRGDASYGNAFQPNLVFYTASLTTATVIPGQVISGMPSAWTTAFGGVQVVPTGAAWCGMSAFYSFTAASQFLHLDALMGVQAPWGALGNNLTPDYTDTQAFLLQRTGSTQDPGDASVQLDGQSGSIVIPAASVFQATKWSIEFWINPTNPNGQNPIIVMFGSWPNRGVWMKINQTGTTVTADIMEGSEVTVSGTVTPGAWNHVVATYDGGTVRIYINGIFIQAANIQYVPPLLTDRFLLGGDFTSAAGYNFMQGNLNGIAWYQYALAPDRILAHYKAGISGRMSNVLDLSAYVRVNPDNKWDPAQGDMLEPAFSDSPFFEGQYLTSMHAKNKEMKYPLFLHPASAPYQQADLNNLIQSVNAQLRPIVDQGQPMYVYMRNAQAPDPTFYTIQFGRFEPDFNFRILEKGWLAGSLHLWTLPYGHTATQISAGTYAAPANQSGMVVQPASLIAGRGTVIDGDLSPQFEILTTVGSYLGDDGRVGIISALPIPSYNPIIPVGSFVGLSPSAVIYGASGAWASQFLAFDNTGGSQGAAVMGTYVNGGFFSFAISPASVYSGENRILGLVRARDKPFGLRAFDPIGNPLGPTVIASALDGWQLVDYGVANVPPWATSALFSIQAYPGISVSASGMVAPLRSPPGWTKEHGPVFVIPNTSSVLDLDWNSPAVAIDGFDGTAGGLLGQDQLGNTWQQSGSIAYTGFSSINVPSAAGGANNVAYMPTTVNFNQNFECDAVVNVGSNALTFASAVNPNTVIGGCIFAGGQGLMYAGLVLGPSPYFEVAGRNASSLVIFASSAVSPLAGIYHLKFVRNASVAWANLGAPSGAFSGAASGAVASIGISGLVVPSYTVQVYPGFEFQNNGGSITIEAFRSRVIASQGFQARDILHLHQPNVTNTRANPSAIDVVDLQARQRGPMQAVNLPIPSMGAGIFVASFPWDQGPANDLLNVDVRVRERFTYAR